MATNFCRSDCTHNNDYDSSAMAASNVPTELYMAEHLVESAGIVLFRLSTKEVCVLHVEGEGEGLYVLPKGRREVGESRQQTALRETREETGLPCRLLPIDMRCHLTAKDDPANVTDRVRWHEKVREPIAVQVRSIADGERKLIWWYVAAVDEEKPAGKTEKETWRLEFHRYGDVLERLTYEDDRAVVERAIELAEATELTKAREAEKAKQRIEGPYRVLDGLRDQMFVDQLNANAARRAARKADEEDEQGHKDEE